MKRYRYVVEYNGILFIVEVEDYEEDDIVVVNLKTGEYEIRYTNEKGKDVVSNCLAGLCLTSNDNITIEDFITHVSFVLNFGKVLAVETLEKQLVVK